MDYDVIIIGAGPGGYTCALACAAYGKKTALIEKDLLGGTCLNRGCIPTKTLLFAGALLDNARNGKQFGIAAENVSADFPALRARCAEVVTTLRGGIAKLLKQKKVTVIEGEGKVTAAHTVTVGGETLTADDIVLATGSIPAVPPIPGRDLPGVYTSDTILADIPKLDRLVIIGGGVIGCEFAEAYRALGTTVTVIEAMPRILPPMETELARRLTADFKKKGVAVLAKAAVKEITKEDDGLHVRYALGDAEKEIAANGVLIATGRRAGAQDLTPFALENNRGRLIVDETCRTSEAHLYAIGDLADGAPQLAHTAEAQAKIAAAAIAGKISKIRLDLIPSVVYTKPELAAVGMTEDEAKAKGISYKTGKAMMGANAKSLIAGEGGAIKLLTDENGKLLGASFQCEDAANLVSEATLAIAAGLTAEEFASIVRPHPSVEEALGEAAEAIHNS